jgi:uncharacterized protein involved in type VI secretion and phage assembly
MNGADDDEMAAPARVMAPMAGNRRGVHFFPEKGDEVVVAFEVGDTNKPIILGAVWNGEAPPPDQAKESADNNIRCIVTRSGHELTFDDTPNGQKVLLKTQGGHVIELDDKPSGPKVTVKTSGGRQIVLDDTPGGSAVVQTQACAVRMSDVGGGTVKIEAGQRIELNAGTIAISANALQLSAATGTQIDGRPYMFHTHAGVTTGLGISGPVSS